MSPGGGARRVVLRAAAWLAVALVVVLPRGGLTGHPDVDVWNHAWGYWWFAEALRHGDLPWRTTLLGAPGGGVLWYIDPIGATAALPLTLTLGPAVAFQAVILARVALAGAATQALAEALFGEGAHGWFAGVAFATSPMLLCELHNGISEVVAVYWVPLVLVAALRAARRGTAVAWALAGLTLGLSVLGNFYYGLLSALLLGAVWLGYSRRLRGLVVAGAVAAAVATPGVLALRASVADPSALVMRARGLDRELASHNAVDPRVYVTPGAFWSVNLETKYGEAFRHTGYLRWTVLGLAAAAVVLRVRRERRAVLFVLTVAAGSLILGLGPQLWWGGRFLVVDRRPLLLPFGVLQRLVPELAITHPLRLSVAAQAAFAALASAALVGRRPAWVAVAAVAVAAEGAFGSLARWPVEESPTAIPAVYAEIGADPDPRAVLELPGDIGTRMTTSEYFWFQTVHHHPLPYKPDARANDTGDPETFRHLPDRLGRAAPAPFDEAAVAHLRATYGWVIVHPDLEARAGSAGQLRARLAPILGEPRDVEGLLVWRLTPAGAPAR